MKKSTLKYRTHININQYQMNKFLTLLLGFLLILSSCTDDEKDITANYTTGTFIVNEGPFMGGTGTITYYDGNNATQDVFEKENNGNVLGNIAQSMIKFSNQYFIAVNNAAKIQVVDAVNFKSAGEIKNITLPRYFAATQNRLFVTSWANDFTTGFIHELDPLNLKVLTSKAINGLAERIIARDNFLFISISSYSSSAFPRNVLVMDINTNTIVDTIQVGDNPSDLTFDKNGDIWVTCSGFTDYTDPALSTLGSIHKISARKSVFSYPISNGSKSIVADKKGENIYYISDEKVLEHNINSSSGADKTVIEGAFYSIGYNKQSEELFLGEKEFQKPGKIEVQLPLTGRIPKKFRVLVYGL